MTCGKRESVVNSFKGDEKLCAQLVSAASMWLKTSLLWVEVNPVCIYKKNVLKFQPLIWACYKRLSVFSLE